MLLVGWKSLFFGLFLNDLQIGFFRFAAGEAQCYGVLHGLYFFTVALVFANEVAQVIAIVGVVPRFDLRLYPVAHGVG